MEDAGFPPLASSQGPNEQFPLMQKNKIKYIPDGGKHAGRARMQHVSSLPEEARIKTFTQDDIFPPGSFKSDAVSPPPPNPLVFLEGEANREGHLPPPGM